MGQAASANGRRKTGRGRQRSATLGEAADMYRTAESGTRVPPPPNHQPDEDQDLQVRQARSYSTPTRPERVCLEPVSYAKAKAKFGDSLHLSTYLELQAKARAARGVTPAASPASSGGLPDVPGVNSETDSPPGARRMSCCSVGGLSAASGSMDVLLRDSLDGFLDDGAGVGYLSSRHGAMAPPPVQSPSSRETAGLHSSRQNALLGGPGAQSGSTRSTGSSRCSRTSSRHSVRTPLAFGSRRSVESRRSNDSHDEPPVFGDTPRCPRPTVDVRVSEADFFIDSATVSPASTVTPTQRGGVHRPVAVSLAAFPMAAPATFADAVAFEVPQGHKMDPPANVTAGAASDVTQRSPPRDAGNKPTTPPRRGSVLTQAAGQAVVESPPWHGVRLAPLASRPDGSGVGGFPLPVLDGCMDAPALPSPPTGPPRRRRKRSQRRRSLSDTGTSNRAPPPAPVATRAGAARAPANSTATSVVSPTRVAVPRLNFLARGGITGGGAPRTGSMLPPVAASGAGLGGATPPRPHLERQRLRSSSAEHAGLTPLDAVLPESLPLGHQQARLRHPAADEKRRRRHAPSRGIATLLSGSPAP